MYLLRDLTDTVFPVVELNEEDGVQTYCVPPVADNNMFSPIQISGLGELTSIVNKSYTLTLIFIVEQPIESIPTTE